MKSENRRIKQRLSLLLVLIALFTMVAPSVSATNIEPRASYYLTSYACCLVENSSGGITASYSVVGTGTMSSIGVTTAYIQKKSGASWVTIKTLTSGSNPSFLATNTFTHSGDIRYSEVASNSTYRVKITVYASNASGSDSRTVTSNTLTIT